MPEETKEFTNEEKQLGKYRIDEQSFNDFRQSNAIQTITDYNNNRYKLGNDVLYNLCKYNPKHNDDKVITAKIWLIGRSYAADIVRGQNKGREKKRTTEEFWTELLGKINKSELDKHLESLKEHPTFEMIIKTHKLLIKSIPTEIDKRSFASKYLHFHCPELFYIYDSRAKKAINKFIKGKIKLPPNTDFDEEYYNFYLKSEKLKKYIEEKCQIKCDPRKIDMILLKSVEEQNEQELLSQNQ